MLGWVPVTTKSGDPRFLGAERWELMFTIIDYITETSEDETFVISTFRGLFILAD
jgi:hypothetical protein